MIIFNSIHKQYSKQEVLKGVSMEIPKGTIQAILGVNGAGKTTLINILSGIISCDKGNVCIDNQEVGVLKYKFRSNVGCVLETPVYINKFSANEYLTFIGSMYGIKKDVLKNRVNELIDFFDFPPKKYIDSYSKGMKSKVSLAGALIHDPEYLILDEPFDGVDFLSIQKITRLFKVLASKGCTILITSHQFDVIAELCDRLAILKDGMISMNSSIVDLHESSSEANLKNYVENIIVNNV